MPFILVYFAILEKLKCGLVYLQYKSSIHILRNIYLFFYQNKFLVKTFENSQDKNKQTDAPPPPKKKIIIKQNKYKDKNKKTKGIRDMGLWDNAHTSG